MGRKLAVLFVVSLLCATSAAALQETGATGADGEPTATGVTGATGGDATKVELAKKKEAEEKANTKKKETIQQIKAVVDGAIADTEKLSTEQKAACITEEKAAVQWSKEADPAAAEVARKQRKKNKEALLEAIEYRQKVLKKFLDKLYAARYTLGDSIHRTNNLYFSAYDANVNTQVVTRNALKFLGIAFETKHSGGFGVFRPIKLPNIADDEREEEEAEKNDGVDMNATTDTAGKIPPVREFVKQEVDLAGISQTEFKENEDKIVAGIASALKLDSLAVKVLNVKSEGSRRRRPLAAKLKVVLEVGCPYTPTDTVKGRMESGSFKKSLCDEIARATRHALKDIVVEDMRTWVEPNDKAEAKVDGEDSNPTINTTTAAPQPQCNLVLNGFFLQEDLRKITENTFKMYDGSACYEIGGEKYCAKGNNDGKLSFEEVYPNGAKLGHYTKNLDLRKLWNRYADKNGHMGKDELPKYVEFIAVERMYNQIAEQIDANQDGVVTAKDIEVMVNLIKKAGIWNEGHKSIFDGLLREMGEDKNLDKHEFKSFMCKFIETAQPWKPDGEHYVWDLSNAQFLLLELKSHRISNKYIENLMRNTVIARPMVASFTKRDDIKVSLMEMEAQVHQKISKCVGEECDPAMQSTWILHKLAFDTDCANYKVFDVEQRTPLAAYREGLKKLIKSREEKLKALEIQATALRASLADPGQTLAELLPLISKHVQIQDVACKKMPVNTEKMLKELKAIQSDIAHGTFDCSI